MFILFTAKELVIVLRVHLISLFIKLISLVDIQSGDLAYRVVKEKESTCLTEQNS